MENVLVISSSASLEQQLGKLLETPDRVDRVCDLADAQQFLTRHSPAVVMIDSAVVSPAAAPQLVQLNDVLSKDDRCAYFLGDNPGGQLDQWIEMFDVVADDVVSPDDSSRLQQLLQRYLDDADAAEDPPTATSSNNSGADDSGADEPIEVVVRLPRITDGSLDNIPLGRVLYSLRLREQTGVLELSHRKMSRQFAFQAGRFVSAPDHDDLEALASAYAWDGGDFQFRSRQSLSGSPRSTFLLMIDGLKTHRGQRQLMSGMMSRMQTFPVVSQLWDERRELIDWKVLHQLLEHCDGSSTLETIFSKFGNQVTDAFAAAAFGRDTDLLVFRGDETDVPVTIQYDQSASISSSSKLVGSSIAAEASEPAASSKVDRATGSDRPQLVRELRSFLRSVDSMSAHDIFGVWEGCGREVVKETYYRMVKEHHPDVYGGNVSSDVRQLAEQIFVHIRNAYTELLKVEGEQTTPPPDTTSPTQQPGRRQTSTLHPGQAQTPVGDATQQPNRSRRTSTPIGLGREPSSAHPEYEAQQNSQRKGRSGRPTPGGTKKSSSSRPQRTSSTSGTSRSSATTDRPGKSRKPKKSRQSKKPRKSKNSKKPRQSRKARQPDRKSGHNSRQGSDEEWRRQRLERLQQNSRKKRRRTASSAGGRTSSSAGGNNTSSKPPEKRAQEAFNTGYKHYKAERYQKAYPLFEKAHKLNSDHGLYMTFLANTIFQLDPDRADRCIDLLEDAIETENRQALPDAHLFLGNILKLKDSEHRAYRHFKRALQLNPGSRDAEREIRLYERRHGKDGKDSDDSGGFFKKLFKK